MTDLATAVVQARMGSSRLPGKVLKGIAGASMLERVLTRTRSSPAVGTVVVATTVLDEDDGIVDEAEELGVQVVRGDSDDVLGRYAMAVRQMNANLVVRITADCPFVDPEVITTVVSSLRESANVDYAANTLEPRTFPRGLDVEAVRGDVILEADQLDDDPSTREHVTPFIRESGRYRLLRIAHHEDLSQIRWTVDTLEDLTVARLLGEHFDGEISMSWIRILEAWRRHPEWHEINAHIEQKAVNRWRL